MTKLRRGKLIVIEGVDGCGKSTQFELLLKRLRKDKLKIASVDFPRYYASHWGKMVGKFLNGEYGDFDTLSPYLVVLPYMLDQYTWGRDIGKELLDSGTNVLANRYFTSNVHQIAKLRGREKENYRRWLWPSGYKQLGLIKPDLVIFLDVPPKLAFEMNKYKKGRGYLNGKKEDEAEKRLYHQIAAYKEYLRSVKGFTYWKRIRCVTGGKIDKPNVIHERLWKEIGKFV